MAAFDADGQVGQLLQYYGRRDATGQLYALQNPMDGVASFDLRRQHERGMILDALDAQADVMLFDFPAGPLDDLENALGTGSGIAPLVEEYNKEGVRITVVMVISNVQASAQNVMTTMDLFLDHVDYVVVKNLFYGNPSDFLFFDGFTGADGRFYGGLPRQALARRGGVVVNMPAVPAREYALCDMYCLGFSEAAGHGAFTRSQRARIGLFLQEFGKAADLAAPYFGYAAAKEPTSHFAGALLLK